ncbi:bifunctional ligase/repressor BirA [Spirochaetia bacterium]|nr:bifunctional ligase/repressor BirA [Spirochaetia bacterium]
MEERYGKAGLLQKLRTDVFGRPLYFFDALPSTNDYAAGISCGAGEGTLVVADAQTAGRGSGGRSWFSPPGAGIWMSLVLIPPVEPRRIRELTLLAAYSITVTLRKKYSVPAMLKWPNDILLNGKKLGGVLADAAAVEDRVRYVVLGLGLNVHTQEFPPELEGIAASLCGECGGSFDRAAIIADFLETLEAEYTAWLKAGSLTSIIDDCNALLVHRGRNVRLVKREGERTVLSLGINAQGELQVQEPGGVIRAVSIGEVSLRGLTGY